MFNIAEFFKRVQGNHAKEFFLREVVRTAVKKNTSVDIAITEMAFSSSVITFKNISSSLRSALFIKKQAILADVNASQSIRIITDIR